MREDGDKAEARVGGGGGSAVVGGEPWFFTESHSPVADMSAG